MRSFLIFILACSVAAAQVATPDNPVYVDDSQAGADVLAGLDGLEQQGSLSEAVRAVQELLDADADRLLSSGVDNNLYLPVRKIVHKRLRDDPRLLEAYRTAQDPIAARQLESGLAENVCRTRFLTPTGFEAALRVAQLQLENASFEASLRTLAELETHPDFITRKAEAAGLLALLARYLDEKPLRMIKRWGVADVQDHISPPASVKVSVIGPTDPGRTSDLDGIIPRPLTSADLSPIEQAPADTSEMPFVNQRQFEDDGIYGWAMPSVVGDVVYTNDGDHITAWDRFTLRQIWQVSRTEPSSDDLFARPDIRRRQSRRIEDSSEVTIAGDRLLAVTGLAVSGTRQGDARLHCLNRTTGSLIWSVDPADLDPAIKGSSMRGPAVVVEGTVVVAMRKWARERRTVSVYLVGLDLDNGLLRWVRLIGSAGALPFQTAGRFPERIAVDRGVVYRSDEIGVLAAVEAATGRPVWVRKFNSFQLYDNDVRPPFTSSGPIVQADRLIVIEPDRENIVTIDKTSGELLDSVPAARFGSPTYLLNASDILVAVSQHQIAWTDLQDFPNGVIRASDALVSPPVIGRVAITGHSVIIPRNGLLTTLDMETRQERSREIDEPGNLLALDGQLVATDESRIHSYMVWEVASKLLEERLENDPSNPAPAATLAELAFRARRFDQILSPIDRALGVIRRNPADHEQTRRDLFVSVLGMLDPTNTSVADTADKAAERPRITDITLLQSLVDRLDALAETPEEMVAHRFVQAEFREARTDMRGAIESLESILADKLMANAFWKGGQLTIRANLEAHRRLRKILFNSGWSTYHDFQREAQAQRDLMGGNPDDERLEQLARQYPFSTLAPEFWLEAARAGPQVHRSRRLLAGIRSAVELHELEAPVAGNVVGELFGLAIRNLVEDRRGAEARQLAQLKRTNFGTLQLTVEGELATTDELLLSQRSVSESNRRARIASRPEPEANPALELGRVLTPAMNSSRLAPTDLAVLASPATQTIRMLQIMPSGKLVERWSRPAPFEPILLELTGSDALIAWLDPAGTRVESIDLAQGMTRWEIQPYGLDDGFKHPNMLSGFITPLEGRVLAEQVLFVADEQLVAMVERSGRITTLDRRTGRTVWSGQSEVQRVFDVALGSGMLVVAGSAPNDDQTWKTRIVALNARTGEVTSQLVDAPGSVRWVRINSNQQLIAGLGRGLMCVDLAESQVRWMLAEEPTQSTIDAWVFGNRLFILDQNRSLWHIDVASGRLLRPELETRGRLIDRAGIQVRSIDDHFMFASGSGMLVYDHDDELTGIDVFDAVGALIPGEPGESLTAMIDSAPVQTPDGMSSYMLYILDNASGRLLSSTPVRLQASPETLTILDDTILISAGEATLVVRAPAEH